ncbi:MAG: hypothetical protein HYR81_04140 [Nitrospirae bacterium]|nr:hypothetical protein [Nitrospirota bacterium]
MTNPSEKHKEKILKVLGSLKENIQEALDFALDNINSIQMDSYFAAEENLERIASGVNRLEIEVEGSFNRDGLKQLETRLFFLEDRFEELDADLRQRPVRRRRPRISLFDFFRFTQGEQPPGIPSGEFKSHLEAFAAFNLKPDAPLKTVTEIFRKMAKELHPDSRGGDRSQEPKLRKLIAAYQYIKEYCLSK